MNQKALGTFFGLLVGDALGAPYEFKRRDSYTASEEMEPTKHFNLPPGYYTDDGSQMLILATSLAEKQDLDPKDFIIRLCRWKDEGYLSSVGDCFDIGIQTAMMLTKFKDRVRLNPECSPFPDTFNERDCGNGSLMRIAAIPLFFCKNEQKAIEAARNSSRVTHPSTMCQEACVLVTVIIIDLLVGKQKAEVLSFDYSQRYAFKTLEILELLKGSYKSKGREQIKSSGYVLHSLEAALWAFNKTDTFKDGLMLVINLGEDTDTIGAIYGQIAGACYGFNAIPERWVKALPNKDQLEALCNKLIHSSLKYC